MPPLTAAVGGRRVRPMTVVVCTDTRGGMLFAGRRQSRDRVMLADLGTLLKGGRLLCHPYSEKLLTGAGLAPTVREDCLQTAGAGDVVFVENLPLLPYRERIARLIVYSWGEAYPYDTRLDLDPRAEGYRLTDTTELIGYSHKCITREVFQK